MQEAAETTGVLARPACAELDGVWQVVFDRGNVGLAGSWHRPEVFGGLDTQPIPVPSCWEEHEQDYEGVAWYARQIDPPADWQGSFIRLRFDAVNAVSYTHLTLPTIYSV